MSINLGPTDKINIKINYFCNPPVISTDSSPMSCRLTALSQRLSETSLCHFD